MADVFSPDWMPLYWRIFLDDVQHLAPDLLGGYVLLLGHQWKEGAIPSDGALQAPIAKLSLARTRALMKALGDRFVPHPASADLMINEFMERVREEQRVRFERQRAKGQKGAMRRWSDGTGNSTGIKKAGDSDSTSIVPANADKENRDSHLASLGESAREAEQTTTVTRSPAYEFCAWFLTQGVRTEAIPGQWEWQSHTWISREIDAAEALLATHGEDECKARSVRLFESCKARRIRRDCSPRTLFDAWDWREIRPEIPTKKNADFAHIEAEAKRSQERLEARARERYGEKGVA